MNRPESLERDLTAWFAEHESPHLPDLTDDILWLTAGTRQRPRWSFSERWLPMSVTTLGQRTFEPFPWRSIGLLAVLALLIAAVAGAYVGGQTRLPAPFGLAANGLVAYAQNGDTFAVDPVTGTRLAITTGPGDDIEPRWSRDGTRIVVMRRSGAETRLVIVDPRSRDIIATSDPVTGYDTDTVSWSPDGRFLTIGTGAGGSATLHLVDASTGEMTLLAIDYAGLDVYWRPGTNGELLVLTGNGPDVALSVVNIDDGTAIEVARPLRPGASLRPTGWTADGRRVVYTRGDEDDVLRTHVRDMATGAEVRIDAAHGRISNDGTRMVAFDGSGRMCIVPLSAGPCVRIGAPSQQFDPGHAFGGFWSPDDAWIVSRPGIEDLTPPDYGAVLVDPDGAALDQPSWLADGGVSWQRVAP